MANVVVSFKRTQEYRVALPRKTGRAVEDAHAESQCVQEALDYLRSNNLHGVDLESIKFSIEGDD